MQVPADEMTDLCVAFKCACQDAQDRYYSMSPPLASAAHIDLAATSCPRHMHS